MNPTIPVDRNMFHGTVTYLIPGFPSISLLPIILLQLLQNTELKRIGYKLTEAAVNRCSSK